MGTSVIARPRPSPQVDVHDPEDLAEILLDLRKGLRFIRDGQGYGRVTVEVVVRKGQITGWETAPALSRKPGHSGK